MFKKAIHSSIRNEFLSAAGTTREDLGILLNGGSYRCYNSCIYISNSEKSTNNQVVCPLKKHGKGACEGIRVIINHIAGMTDKYALLEYTRLN
jgi:dGTP triphosphohydrolase